MSNNKPPGKIHTPKQLIELINPESEGHWVEIRNGSHGAAAFVVWRMDGDEASPKQEEFALKAAAANEMFDALEALIRYAQGGDLPHKNALDLARAAIAKATGSAA